MVNYKSEKQLSIFDFKTGFESKLDANNRWVRLCSLLDWDKLSSIYHKSLSTQMGAKGIDSRVVIGALIIKYLERKDDRGTIEAISENPYMQYFLGFDHFDSKPIFDPSLFVGIRKRLGNESIEEMNQIIIKQALTLSQEARPAEDSRKNEEEEKDNLKQNESTEKPLTNKGKLQMDATVADAYIKFPTDLGLLNDSREKSEELLDKLCKSLSIGKPRTYRIKARKEWINLSKNKNKQKKVIRKGINQQLSYLKRNLQSVDKILINNPLALNELTKVECKYLLVIDELYQQQLEMFRQGKVKYNLNKIMAKISDTSESWIAGIFFVMNILKLSKDFLCLFLIRLTNVLFQKNNPISNILTRSSLDLTQFRKHSHYSKFASSSFNSFSEILSFTCLS
jgi:hypothetical protein